VPAGGVEGSKLCLFSIIMPVKCVSSISPRFHYRRLAFCFLPLVTILESSWCWILSKAFSASIEMIKWFLSLLLLMWFITFIDFHMLNHPCIPGMKPTLSWQMILLMCC
jgi:hypothetical protein